MQVSKPDPYTLIVTKNRFGGILYILYNVGFIALLFFWVHAFEGLFKDARFHEEVIDYLQKNPVLYIFILGLLLAIIQQTANVILLIIRGEEYTFDGRTKTVLKNKKYYVSFSEIAHLEIRTPFFGNSIISNMREHILQARLQSLKKFHIHTSYSLSEIGTLAEDIATIIGVGVVRTEL